MRDSTIRVMPSGISSSPWAKAALPSGCTRISWKLSKTTTQGFGSAEKKSRKKVRAKRARFCCGSGENIGSAAAALPATIDAAVRM